MTISEIHRLERKITKAAKRAVRKAVRDHLESGNPIWIIKDGVLTEIRPKTKRKRAS